MRSWLLPALALVAALPTPALAAGEEQGQLPPPPVSMPAPDFLFGQPTWSLAVRGSWVLSSAGSDWYRFVTNQLTLSGGDFNAPAIGADVAFALTPRLDIVTGFDFSRSNTQSEYRHYVDNNRLPIVQTTDLRGVNVGASLRYALAARGREVGSLAWIPRPLVPYVGAGGGMYWFRVRQSGDFVDYQDLSVFNDVFESSGWTPSVQAFGGVDLKLHRRLYLNVEARYVWASADLGPVWIDFDPIDLAGLRIGTGISIVF
jgi:hypothetical protein